MATFLTLPTEIRLDIYRLLLRPNAIQRDHDHNRSGYDLSIVRILFLICSQIYKESRHVFFQENMCVRVETPWPETLEHVIFPGRLPVVLTGSSAARFQNYSLNVSIESHIATGSEKQFFVILAHDLDNFTKIWFYSNLSYPGLNDHLRLVLHLRDFMSAGTDESHMSISRQQHLLLPFAIVKGLSGTYVTANFDHTDKVTKELYSQQAEPIETPENCLDAAVRYKEVGNMELVAGRPTEALHIYDQAWLAMHVVLRGRLRDVHGDAWFARRLEAPPWTGKDGYRERIIIRCQLVANTCLAYLKLRKWDEVVFWGMRSINMLRHGMDPVDEDDAPFDDDDDNENEWHMAPEDEASEHLPAAPQIGKIYYRTALAYNELAKKGKARQLLRVAAIYLPHDQNVSRELAKCALRLL